MGQLIKYEFRKTLFSKMVILGVTAVAEAAFLLGVFMKWDKALVIGVTGLWMCALIGIFYIGIESLITFQRDLNTKQSYMLFLTPCNSFQILGAKVIENLISILAAGAFFAALAAADMTTGMLYIGGLKEFTEMLHDLMITIRADFSISAQDALMAFFTALVGWISTVVTGELAIVLSATVLAGKRFSGFVSFLIFMALNWAQGMVLDALPFVEGMTARTAVTVVTFSLFAALMYTAAGWIMERKLSV